MREYLTLSSEFSVFWEWWHEKWNLRYGAVSCVPFERSVLCVMQPFFFCLFMYLFIHSSYLCFCWCYYTHTWFLGNIKWDAQVLIWGFRPSFRESFHLQAKSDVFQSSRKCQWHYLPMQVNICAWKINLSHEWLKICNVDSCW